LKVDNSLRDIQNEKLKTLRAERDNGAVKARLDAIRAGAGNKDVNLMPLILDAVREYASLGEICNVLRDEFGEYRESIVL